VSNPTNQPLSFSQRLQRVAQAINTASVRSDAVCLELAQDELARLCTEADALEAQLKEQKH
jgi:hypothetical protein